MGQQRWMKRNMMLVGAFALVLGVLAPAGMAAQTPEATPGATPAASGNQWQVTDVREIEVDGEPIALSPDGQWLAGTRGEDHDEVCAWDVETLTPTCVTVSQPVQPYTGDTAMRWAPDSSAFAFVEGSVARMTLGDVYVFEVATGTLANLTNTGGVTNDGPMYIGADWTSDSGEVVFGVNYGIGGDSRSDEVVRVSRSGGDPAPLPLPEWSNTYDILFPPLVAGDSVFVSISAETDIAGIWRVPFDGAEPKQVVAGHGDRPVDFAMPATGTDDGRFLNVISVTGLQRLLPEETFFLLETESGRLTPLISQGNLPFIAFASSGHTGLMVQEDRLATFDAETGSVTPVDGSPEVGSWLMTIPTWSDNGTIFLPADQGGVLVTLEQVS